MTVHPIKQLLANPRSQSFEREMKKSSVKPRNEHPVVLTRANIARLWLSLSDIYGDLFLSKNGIEDSGAWFETLKDLTPFALENGLEKLRTLKAGKEFLRYPPNCLEFRSLCLSFYEDLGLPSVNDAFIETQSLRYTNKPNWSHPAVKYTASKLGRAYLAIEYKNEAFAVFKKAYEQVCHLVRQGGAVPEVKDEIFIAHDKSREVALHHLNNLRQMLGMPKRKEVTN